MEAGGIDGGGGGLANGTVEEIVEQIIAGSHGLPDDDDQRTRFERLQMQRIRELDMEQLEVEDVDSETGSILSDNDSRCFPFMPFLYPPLAPYSWPVPATLSVGSLDPVGVLGLVFLT
jgi:hypothetical protein